MSPVNPTRLIGGRYVVLAELGRGSMGVVWRAEDRVMARQVAVKELHLPGRPGLEERQLFRERLLSEARTVGRLDDPGIATVYDVVTDDGVDHIVMELIDAPTLAEVVRSDGPLDERAAADVAQQLLAALRTAHDSGVVHGDVKPGNVLLGPGGRVRLTDFGIAQAADDPRLTTSGAVVGAPGCVSPERLEGAPATPASDLWALGATLFHAVRGSGPFARETRDATISAVRHAEVPPVRARGPLGAVIAGLLQRVPEARLTGVQAAALLASQDAEPSARDDAATVPATTGRRGRAWVAAALALGLAAGLAGGVVAGRAAGPGTATLTYGDGGDLPVFGIRTEACLSGTLTAGGQFPPGSTVSCEGPHDLEIFGTLDPFGMRRELPYPGREALAEYASAACTLVFDSALVVPEGKERLEVVALVPSEGAFGTRAGSGFPGRDVICVLRAADGSRLTGSRLAEHAG